MPHIRQRHINRKRVSPRGRDFTTECSVRTTFRSLTDIHGKKGTQARREASTLYPLTCSLSGKSVDEANRTSLRFLRKGVVGGNRHTRRRPPPLDFRRSLNDLTWATAVPSPRKTRKGLAPRRHTARSGFPCTQTVEFLHRQIRFARVRSVARPEMRKTRNEHGDTREA